MVDDPDAPDLKAPKLTWVHWVLYNLPPTAGAVPEAVAPDALPPGTQQGLNDWGRPGYGGPCPPSDVIATSTSSMPWTRFSPAWTLPTRGEFVEGDGGPCPRRDRARRNLPEGRPLTASPSFSTGPNPRFRFAIGRAWRRFHVERSWSCGSERKNRLRRRCQRSTGLLCAA